MAADPKNYAAADIEMSRPDQDGVVGTTAIKNDTSRHTIVHCEGEEGGLVINTLTGAILTPLEDRPEWSHGLLMANPAERILFYEHRLGPEMGAFAKTPGAIDFRDLEWEVMTEELEAHTQAADSEFRMDRLAQIIGLSREADAEAADYGPGELLAEVEIGMHKGRTDDEVHAFNDAQTKGFEDKKQAQG